MQHNIRYYAGIFVIGIGIACLFGGPIVMTIILVGLGYFIMKQGE